MLSLIYLVWYRATPERERDRFDDLLNEIPAQVVAGRPGRAAGRRPKGWGPGDDEAIEADAGLAALASLRTATRRR